jgi:hypothetical protein
MATRRGTPVGVRFVSAIAGVGFILLGQLTAASADSSPSPSPPPGPSPSPVQSPPPPLPATLTLSTSAGPVGTVVAITGLGFPPSTDVAVYIDSPDRGYVATPARLNGGSGPQTDPGGALLMDILVTPAAFGAHAICADTSYPGSPASKSAKACAPFSVQPQLTLSRNFGLPGDQVTLTATGFPAFATVAFYTDTPRDGSPGDGNISGPFFGTPGEYADQQGTLVQTITWPHNFSSYKVNPETPGPHVICGDSGYPGSQQTIKVKACAGFQVGGSPNGGAQLVLRPSTGGPGTKVMVQGSGFAGKTHVYITLDGQTGASAACSATVTDISGNFLLELMIDPTTDDGNCYLTSPSGGPHQICVDAMVQTCTEFVFIGAAAPPAGASPPPTSSTTTPAVGTTPAAAHGLIARPAGLPGALVVVAGVVGLLLLAVGGVFFARWAAKPKSLPPPG